MNPHHNVRSLSGHDHARGLSVAITLVAAVIVGVGCRRNEAQTASASSGLQGVVLILLDTVRADHLSCYGYDRKTSPNMDALAEQGVQFKQVVAPSPWTLPSVGAMLTAEYPERGFAQSGELSWSLVEHFRRAGISTAGITEGGYVSRAFGMDRGFAHYVEEKGPVQLLKPGEKPDPNARVDIENTFALARRWLVEHRNERFFLFIHTYEPHTPYTRRDFARAMDAGAVGPVFTIEFLRPLQTGEIVLSGAEVEYVKALYDGGILHADRHVGAFVSFLEAVGLKDRTLVVVTSDHGEELNDHYPGNTGDHGHSLRDPLLLVPLILYHPSQRYPVSEVVAQVRLIDVMPTIAELLGVPIDRPIDGKSLIPLMTGAETENRLALTAHSKKGPPRIGIRHGGFKYVISTGNDVSYPKLKPAPPSRQLYDLTADPLEKTNLAAVKPELAAVMSKALEDAYASFAKPVEFTTPDVADQALLERLKSLGYVGD